MEVSNPRDDRAERNLGGASVPLSTVIPWVGNFNLEQNPILDSYIVCVTVSGKSKTFQSTVSFKSDMNEK